MTTTIDYALMAGHAYRTTRDEINWFPIPQGWAPFFPVPDPTTAVVFPVTSGFEAVSFQNVADRTKIVIAFAGTDGLLSVDQFANLGLAEGFGSTQLTQAADYYLAIKAANPGPNVTFTFTGHSLGGGLAALMGVFFGKQAVTFDQAPFYESATLNLLRPDVAANLRQHLLDKALTDPDQVAARNEIVLSLSNFLALREANGGIPNSSLVSTIRVDGEFLGAMPYMRIGTELPPLTHGVYFGPFDLHSQALLTTFVQSDAFREMTNRLPELLGMIFDSKLFAYDT